MDASDKQSAHRAQLAAIVDSSDDAIVGKTLDGVITSWNRGAEQIFGYTAEEAVGRHVSLIIPEDRLTEEEGVLARLRNGEKIDHFETIRRTKDGRLVEISLTVSPVRGENGRIIGASKVARDITFKRRAEKALRDNQALFREMADTAPAILWVTNAVGDCTFLSRRWQEFTGLNEPAALEFGLWGNLHPDDQATVRGIFQEANLNHTAFTLECRIRRAAGDYRWILMSGEPRFADERVFAGFVGSVIDITERRMAEDTVRDEIQVREMLARAGASLASELNPEKLVQLVVTAATRLISAEFGTFSYTLASDTSEPEQLYAEAGTAGAPVRSELVVPVISRAREVVGRLHFVHSRSSFFTSRHEQLAGGIAAWAALALDNARLYKSARDANVTKDEFLATLSHELRTPLNAMLGWTHMLRSGSLTPEMQRRALEALERNGRSQAQLVDDLLDVSRIVSGRLQIRFEEVDLATVIGSALDTVRPAAAAKLLDIRVAMPPERVMVRGDMDRLRQIFWNLLSNAVKFTPSRGRIDVGVRQIDGDVEIVVSDTGLGIRREFLKHVFERFRQADSTHGRKYGGLGLGLAIVRHLAEAHGGSVQVESAGEGQGATFTVRLPVLRVHRGESSDETSDQRRGTALAGLQILVVEDEPDAREFLGALLTMHGARVELTSSAGEALGRLAGGGVDVLLADLGLPDRDGYSLIQAIRSLDPELGGAVPAVAVTAYAGLRERARAFEAGYGWHVAKPVDPDQLLTIVTAAARSRGLPVSDLVQPSES